MVGWVVGGQAGGPWVSHGSVAGGLLSSQTASELWLAGLTVRFPIKVQLRKAGVLIRPEAPHSCRLLPDGLDGPRTEIGPGRCGEQWEIHAGSPQAASHSHPGDRPRTLPRPHTPKGNSATPGASCPTPSFPISPRSSPHTVSSQSAPASPNPLKPPPALFLSPPRSPQPCMSRALYPCRAWDRVSYTPHSSQAGGRRLDQG